MRVINFRLAVHTAAAVLFMLLAAGAGIAQDLPPNLTLINQSVLSPKEKYPLHVHVIQSDAHFVPAIDYSSSSYCYMLFGMAICNTSGTATPTTVGRADMTVSIEESGETATIYCRAQTGTYCAALPLGVYAARFRTKRAYLVIPVALTGEHHDKEYAAIYLKPVREAGKRSYWVGMGLMSQFYDVKK